MGKATRIEWCDHSFNIVWGCQRVSPGCEHCYAEKIAERFGYPVWGPPKNTTRRAFGEAHWREPVRWNTTAERAGVRRRVFCASMGDVFENHPTVTEQRRRLWPLIRATPNLDWLLLTKRPKLIDVALPPDWGEGYPNVWLGTSIETRDYGERAEALMEVPARIRFLSLEPLLGPVRIDWPVDWVIAGGESGAECRPMDLNWVRSIRDDCDHLGIPFFLKQLGGHPKARGHGAALLDGRRHTAFPVLLSSAR